MKINIRKTLIASAFTVSFLICIFAFCKRRGDTVNADTCHPQSKVKQLSLLNEASCNSLSFENVFTQKNILILCLEKADSSTENDGLINHHTELKNLLPKKTLDGKTFTSEALAGGNGPGNCLNIVADLIC